MRLPLRHPPPAASAARLHCAYLDALCDGLVGIPLAAAASHVASDRSRGRFGQVVQWHLGLAAHDTSAAPDWEGTIEVKLVTTWRRRDGRIGCDKTKVCEAALDPAAKIGNVRWIVADRLTRVVLGWTHTTLEGAMFDELRGAWSMDPDVDDPPLFVESRDGDLGEAPAYYLSSAFVAEHAGVAVAGGRALTVDASWWSAARKSHAGRDPCATVIPARSLPVGQARWPCPRCGAPVTFARDRVSALGWAPGVHESAHPRCRQSAHFVVDVDRLPSCRVASIDEQVAWLEGREDGVALARVADRVTEPEDHGHLRPR